MLDALRSFMYLDTDTLLHKLDPRTKLFLAIWTIAMCIALDCLRLSIVIAYLIVLTSIGGARCVSQIARVVKGVCVFMIIVFAINTVFAITFGGISIVESAKLLHLYIDTLARIIAATIGLSILVLTTTPSQILSTLGKVFGYTLLYLFLAMYRFIPIALRDVAEIYEAQLSRGIPLDSGNPFKRIRLLMSVIVPAAVMAIVRAKEFSEALELRGFGYSKKRTFLYRPRPTAVDAMIIATSLALAVSLLVVTL